MISFFAVVMHLLDKIACLVLVELLKEAIMTAIHTAAIRKLGR